MSRFITPASVQAIAHSLDIPQLSDEAAKALAPDVEYRLREVIQVRPLQWVAARCATPTDPDSSGALRGATAEHSPPLQPRRLSAL
jgi:hypothetical protein